MTATFNSLRNVDDLREVSWLQVGEKVVQYKAHGGFGYDIPASTSEWIVKKVTKTRVTVAFTNEVTGAEITRQWYCPKYHDMLEEVGGYKYASEYLISPDHPWLVENESRKARHAVRSDLKKALDDFSARMAEGKDIRALAERLTALADRYDEGTKEA